MVKIRALYVEYSKKKEKKKKEYSKKNLIITEQIGKMFVLKWVMI